MADIASISSELETSEINGNRSLESDAAPASRIRLLSNF
jgi:hypothetical protein